MCGAGGGERTDTFLFLGLLPPSWPSIRHGICERSGCTVQRAAHGQRVHRSSAATTSLISSQHGRTIDLYVLIPLCW